MASAALFVQEASEPVVDASTVAASDKPDKDDSLPEAIKNAEDELLKMGYTRAQANKASKYVRKNECSPGDQTLQKMIDFLEEEG